MKRTCTATLALILCCLLILPVFTAASARDAETQVGMLTGETSRETKEITLSDGTPTGVLWTQIMLEGYYGNKVVNVAEFNLSNTHLSLEVVNSGKTIVSSATTASACETYVKTHNGQTVLAAVNGDLWMTKVHSNEEVTKQTLKVPRGVLIMNGEIWASQQIDMENYCATNAEKGTPAGDKAAFGVTDTNQPLVGSPDIKVSIEVDGKTLTADGLNRLPCWNSLIVYNWRLNNTNYALDDAYEVEIEVENSAFTAGGTVTGTVKAVYPANSETRPGLNNKKVIVLTARGNKIATLRDAMKVGDTVTFNTTLTDRWGHTDLWQNVTEAIGGHMQVLLDGKQGVANGSTSEYPTSLIGYRDDGSVMLVTVTSVKEKTYAGLKFSQALKFCKEMGYNSVFYLDGGGSSTFVTYEDGTYTPRNNCSDGSPRSVINSIGVVWNDTPVCERQGSTDYIEVPVDLSQIMPTYMDGALLAEVVGGPNAVNMGYDADEKAFYMTTSMATQDPYATLSFEALEHVQAQNYPYLVFVCKSTHPVKTTFKLYYAAGSVTGASESCTTSFSVDKGDEWQYIIVDMTRAKSWNGELHNIRLDIFDSTSTPADTTMYIQALVLCEYPEDAQNVINGWIPEDGIGDFLAYKESLKPVVTEPETEPPTEPETEAPTDPETESATEPVTEAPTDPETVTEAPTESPSEAPTETPTEPETQPAASGCASTLTLAALTPLLCAWFAVRKKK